MSPPDIQLFKSLHWMDLRTSENINFSTTRYQNPLTYSDLNSTNHKDQILVNDTFRERTTDVWPNKQNIIKCFYRPRILMLFSMRFDNYKKRIYRHCNMAAFTRNNAA
jgi:hypothetical protein